MSPYAKNYFDKYITIFGVNVVCAKDTPNSKCDHAGNVLAQYLDNNEDGCPDNGVADWLAKKGATLVMPGTSKDGGTFWNDRVFRESLEKTPLNAMQDLYPHETHPKCMTEGTGPFDASLEEVLHFVTNGYVGLYPKAFGTKPGSSELTKAMDVARGGQFIQIPAKYPDNAWYSYTDQTCNYTCMAVEYFYWVLTSALGGQCGTNR